MSDVKHSVGEITGVWNGPKCEPSKCPGCDGQPLRYEPMRGVWCGCGWKGSLIDVADHESEP